MSVKFERIGASGVVTQSAVKRRESLERDGSSDQKFREESEAKSDEDGEKKEPDRGTVEKALADLATEDGFTRTGMKVEVLNGKEGMRIRLAQSNGEVVKVMTAEEFLKLRENSEDGEVPRGKILDQKF